MTQHIKNRDVFLKDPLENRLVNQGVVEVAEPGSEQEVRTLRHEIETFVCEGQYARGLERILSTYVANLDREEQPAVWVSGFYGSGKSHLVKMLRFLWTDYRFPDGATARGLAQHLPDDIHALLRELSTQGKRLGGLHAAGGKLGAGAGTSVRLALLGLIFRSAGLPEDYAAARFVLFLKRNGFLDAVKRTVEAEGRPFDRELKDLYVSPLLARALLAVHPAFAPSEEAVLGQITAQFERPVDISDTDMTTAIEEALGQGGKLPATLIVLDEVQQYIGETSSERAYRVQELAEACSKRFGARILFVGTGQTAITGTPQLQKLQARFRLAIELSDADVDTVVRKIVLAKKPDKETILRRRLAESSGEISRHLPGTRLAPRPEDDEVLVADYPLLPTRRRFWELALRAIDPTGTKAELRNQLINVYEAVIATADKDLLNVVPADFLYDQNKTQMVQAGALLREIQEVIERLDDGSESGRLKSRLCALCFLIGKLPREAGADSGLRTTPDMLADLLVEDLEKGSYELRKIRIPQLLDELAADGTLILVAEEYRIQTRESAAWESEYRSRLSRIQNDPGLAVDRADLLRQRVVEALKGVKLPHGQSKVQRKIQLHFGQDKPTPGSPEVPVWVRDGWNDDEKSVLADARKEGPDSPLVFVFLPEHATDELRKHLASAKAASETLAAKGKPGTKEGLEARQGMETRQRAAEQQREALLRDVLAGARVILAGSGEHSGASLVERVRQAAEDALHRLYTQFDYADHAHWDKVIERAQKGAADALNVVGFSGDPEKHRVCQALLAYVAGGKKGREIRKHFEAPSYGWPQDAIDAALILLVATGHLRAAHDGRPLGHKQLDQKIVGVADFRCESATVTTPQKIALRRLFQEAGIQTAADEEVTAARNYLQALKALAVRAGGEAPLPSPPNPPRLGELASLAGNEQLIALFNARDELSGWWAEWSRRADLIGKRYPRWQALERLAMQARALSVAADVAPQIDALQRNRALLNEPDPVTPLIGRLVQALRETLQREREAYAICNKQEKDRLAATDTWQRLSPEQQADILNRQEVAGVPEVRVGTEEELLASLAEISLDSWATRRDALPQRFAKALEEAVRLLEPKAVRVTLPSATIRDREELRDWLKKVETTVSEKLGDGPVIV